MKKIQYSLITIAGQKTALVEESYLLAPPLAGPTSTKPNGSVNPLNSAQIANQLMQYDQTIEQVGFLNPNQLPYPNFSMMGEELSIIGSLAAGITLLKLGKNKSLQFYTSGLEQLVTITNRQGRIILDLPNCLIVDTNQETMTVKLSGIQYKLIKGLRSKKLLKPEERSWLRKTVKGTPAAGLIFFAQQTIQPVVLVKATNSLVWESACGSGSIAFFILTGLSKIKQPSNAYLQIIPQDDKLQVIVNSKDILYEK